MRIQQRKKSAIEAAKLWPTRELRHAYSVEIVAMDSPGIKGDELLIRKLDLDRESLVDRRCHVWGTHGSNKMYSRVLHLSIDRSHPIHRHLFSDRLAKTSRLTTDDSGDRRYFSE